MRTTPLVRSTLLPTLLTAIWLFAACGGDTPPPADASGADATSAADAVLDAGPADTGAPDAGPTAPLAVPKGGYKAIFIDIGQGDATLLVADTGETLLIDAGASDKLIIQRLVALGVERVDAIIATHADADHIGGLASVMAYYPVKTVYWNGLTKETQVFKGFFEAASKTKLVAPKRGDKLALGNLSLEVLHPGDSTDKGDHNGSSIVVMTGCSGAWMMLTGDAEAEAEQEMLSAGVLSDVDVLKVAHHGSASGTTQAFLDAVKPEHGVISAGLDNKYGHPDKGVVTRLEAAGAKVHQCDDTWNDDTVIFTTACKGSYTLEPLVP